MKQLTSAFIFAAIVLVTLSFRGKAFTTAESGTDYGVKNELPTVQTDELPKVFMIGEYMEAFDTASAKYDLQLLEACNNDMNLAYFKWLSMLQAIEDYANTIDFEIRGVKMWVKFFWSEDGSIDHIAYYLKPKSRNVPMMEMTAFFTGFMEEYQFPLISEQKYSHYGSASFPVLPVRLSKKAN